MKNKRPKRNSHDSNRSKSSPRKTPTTFARKRQQQKQNERKKLTQEILAESLPPTSPPYTLQDVTQELAAVPEKLEIHPTKTAPTLAEVENRLTREREHEKLKFFSVPIKMYENEINEEHNSATAIDLSKVEFTEDDRIELDRYGSRVVMNEQGHVAALEVQQDVMNQFKKNRLRSEICQCTEKEYEVSERLKHIPRVRRLFMGKVLLVECLLKAPSFLFLYYQKEYTQLHDFIYQQNLLIFFMIAIVQGTRLAGIYFSEVGRYEPCRTIITVLTMAGYCMISVLMTALLQQYSIYFVDYKLYEDPVSLESLQLKRKKISGSKIAYPYVVTLLIGYTTTVNLVLAFILMACNKRVMKELGNGFLLIIIVTSVGLAILSFYAIIVLRLPFFSKNPIGWDKTQLMFSFLMTIKWSMWRFYMLQQLVKGKTMRANEEIYQFVALNFAF